MALFAASAAFALSTGMWKKSFAKKFVASCTKDHIADKFLKEIKQYWNDTEVAFNAAADNMDKEWREYLNTLREQVSNADTTSIENKKSDAELMQKLIGSISY